MSEPTVRDAGALSEGGLRAPPGLSPLGKLWWWFHFLILVKLARLRFIAVLAAIAAVIVYWDTLKAHYDKWMRPAGAASAAAPDVEFFCSMQPEFVTDDPKALCPICHMGLTKRKKGEVTNEALPAGVVSRKQYSPYRVALAGVQTWEVGYRPLAKEVTTVGFVEFDERRLKHIAARVKGRLDTLHVNVTGQRVGAGDELASIYSPDLVVTVRNLLDAQRSGNPDLLRIARDRLRLWDVSEAQIDDILRTGQANTHLKIRSPISGHVIRKYQVEGKYVEEGSPLYDVADLSTVWVQAQVYEDQIAFLKEGLRVRATTPALPNRPFEGRVAFIYPHLDQASRTLTARFDIDNPDHALRPGLYATVTLQVPYSQLEVFGRSLAADWQRHTAADVLRHALFAPAGVRMGGVEPLLQAAVQQALLRQGQLLAVPETAVIDTGSQKVVYRQISPTEYEGVEVELGPRSGSFYPVLRGLEAGDRVVTAGSFLIDADTKLNPAAGSIYIGGGDGKDTSAGAVRPTTPADADAEVRAARARIRSPQDRRLVEAQDYCPVLEDSRLGSMGPPVKVLVKGQPVFLCCKSCEKQALAKADETLATVEKLRMKKQK
jgi:Cu(I)/Ag(I) efflux system membrane fusion protein